VNLEVRKPIIAGNWKMHKSVAEARKLALDIKNATMSHAERIDVVVCPPFASLYPVAEVLKGSKIYLAAQNCYWEDKGAFTGEISPVMLRDIGCTYTITGHSERRSIFAETDQWVANKAKALLAHGISPIVCVGEKLEDREAGTTKDIVRAQILGSLRNIDSEEMLRTVVAYEPIWAIGTGKTATPEQAQEVHAFIRNVLSDLHGLEVALRVRIQYGGSVKSNNIASLMAQSDIDGALVGGASLEARSFAEIVAFRAGGKG
jgi:triosephosphate isomerase